MDEVVGQALQLESTGEARAMHTPDDVQAMLKLVSLGWGAKRIAKEVGCSRNTVRRYLRHGRPPVTAIGQLKECLVTSSNAI